MKHSIRRQFTCIFIGMMAATVAVCWLLNSLFLEKYYRTEKQKNLLEVYYSINDAIEEGIWRTEEYSNVTLMNLCSKYTIAGIVIDTRTQEIISFGADEKQSHRQLWDNLIMTDRKDEEYLIDAAFYRMMIVKDRVTKTDYMELWGNLNNGDVFLLRTALEGVRESVSIANRFLGYMGIISSLVSSVLIWLLTKKYTGPILELAQISRRMANLDFKVKYRGQTENEIGILGSSINHMSEELEKNISRLKTANMELTKDIRNKEKLEEMRTEFLSGISHELKTPIALIQGYAEGLKDNISEDLQEREFYCDVIIDEASKMNEIVKKLIVLNHLEYEKNIFQVERVDLSQLLCQFIKNRKALAEQAQIVFLYDVPPNLFGWGDEFRIEEIIDNYFSNAVHYVEEDAQGNKMIRIILEEMNEHLRVSVFNTGSFIAEEAKDRVWEKFYKVDKARTREYGGSGIGLSIVKAILDSLNQRYGFKNEEDGVTFWFELDKA